MVTDHRQPESLNAQESTRGGFVQQLQKGALTTPVEALRVHNEMESATRNTSPNNTEPTQKGFKTESDCVAEFSSSFRPNEPSSVLSNSRLEGPDIINNEYYTQPRNTENCAPKKSIKINCLFLKHEEMIWHC